MYISIIGRDNSWPQVTDFNSREKALQHYANALCEDNVNYCKVLCATETRVTIVASYRRQIEEQ